MHPDIGVDSRAGSGNGSDSWTRRGRCAWSCRNVSGPDARTNRRAKRLARERSNDARQRSARSDCGERTNAGRAGVQEHPDVQGNACAKIARNHESRLQQFTRRELLALSRRWGIRQRGQADEADSARHVGDGRDDQRDAVEEHQEPEEHGSNHQLRNVPQRPGETGGRQRGDAVRHSLARSGQENDGPAFISKAGLFVIGLSGTPSYIAASITLAENVTVRRGSLFHVHLTPGESLMTSRIRAILGSSLMAAAIAIAPLAASAQATTAPTTPKVTKTTTKATTHSTAKTASKAAATAAKADEKTETKTVKVAEKKVATAKTAEKKAVVAETKAVAAAEAKAVANKIAAAPPASPKAVAKANAKSAVAVTDASNNVAAGATAKCKDGTYSHAKNHTGACSGHGGVASWM